MNITQKITQELQVKPAQVEAAIQLLDEGATVPFIARYRKEVTGGLTDTQLRDLSERLIYLRELEERRQTIINSITEQNKLTPELEKSIMTADNKALLEDLYLPYKPKRHSKAQIAREAGLESLALLLLQQPQQVPETAAQPFLNSEKNIAAVADALEGARQILLEMFAENADLLGTLREYLWQHAIVTSNVIKDKENDGKKFTDYFDYQEPIKRIPSHRALALFRGQREQILRVKLTLSEDEEIFCRQQIATQFSINSQAASPWMIETIAMAWRIKLFLKLELDLMMRVWDAAEEEAIKVFANNLRHLLMAAPAGALVTMGLDPGLRTGVKVVVVDDTGKLLTYTTIFPHAPRDEWDQSIAILAKLCQQLQVQLISIGNGTASRETDKLVSALKKQHPELKLLSIVVSEAGASVYSASKLAAEEFPELDVTYRGAVSIARRLQDPLAELVKIDPKSIGVGQYQHDVNQPKLGRMLHAVMEDCVNAVGANLNTASVPLLTTIAGLNTTMAANIVQFRESHGRFKNRAQLLEVPRFGKKTFEQAAGFLRIVNGDNPLDASAVHPEAYPVVERILSQQNKMLPEIMGNCSLLKSLKPADYIDEKFGIPTVTDILNELEKPGRDPRPAFKTADFREGVETLKDLAVGMVLEGVITNVANFGAFVDVGVHQDGLVHKSMMSNRFVKDPAEIVKVGDIVKVKVMEIDIPRKRISLSMRLEETAANKKESSFSQKKPPFKSQIEKTSKLEGSLADSLRRALNKN